MTDRRMPLPDIPSPCVGVCAVNPSSGQCVGCLRSIEEIGAWPRASNEERLAILERLKERRRAAGRTSAADQRPRRRARRATRIADSKD
ncbi:DUF1289 domain-containing protein [Hwanghaeella sp.]|uniref:DUF1289 domain-containing protein n=1 Tax=Hwanghaeella sp. TaxID=2605943 RepID=UPI003CCBC9D5